MSDERHTISTREEREMEDAVDPTAPGFVLRNGAILLADKPSTYTRQGDSIETVVLAFAPGTFEPFCVWSRSRGSYIARGETFEFDETISGEYFQSIDRAVAAYKERES